MPSTAPRLFVPFCLLSLLLAVHAHPYPYRYQYHNIRHPRARTSFFPLVVRPRIPRPVVTPPVKHEKHIPPPFQPHLSSHLQTVHSPLPATNDGGRVFPTSAFYPLNFTLSTNTSRKANLTSTSHHNHTAHVLNSTVKASAHGRQRFLNNAMQMFTISRLHRILSTLTSVRPIIHRRSTSSLGGDLSVEVLHNVTVPDVIDILSNASAPHPCASSTSNHTTDYIPSSTHPSNHTHISSNAQPNITHNSNTHTSSNSQSNATFSPSTPQQSPIATANPPTTFRHQSPHLQSHSYQPEQRLHSLLNSLASSLDALGYTPGTTLQAASLKSRLQLRKNSSQSDSERFRHLQRSVVDLYRYITGRSKPKSGDGSNRQSPLGAHHRSTTFADHNSTLERNGLLTTNASSNPLRVKSAFSENAEEDNVENMPDVEDENEEGHPCDEEPASTQFGSTVSPSPMASPKSEVNEAAPSTFVSEQDRTSEDERGAIMSPMSTPWPSASPSEASPIDIPPMAVPMSLESEKTVERGDGIDGLRDGENVTQLAQMVYKVSREANIFSMAAAPCDGIDGLRDGENVTQLAQMVYKVSREANIFSMAAAPCDEVTDWMPDVIRKLQSELVGLQFYCIDTREPVQDMTTLRQVFGDVASAILQANVNEIKDIIPKELDMVVSWKGLQRWGLDKGWRFMRGLRDSGAKYVLVSNNPRISNLDENMDAVNVRRSPLLFGEPRRIISGITPDSSTELLLYAMDEVRDGF